MITISELIAGASGASYPAADVNPLTEGDALQEAQLLALKFDAVAGTASLLFELRVALQLHETNTGVVVARGVRRLTWSGPERRTSRTAWTVGGSTVRAEGALWRMELGLWPSPGAQVELAAEAAFFFAGDVPGLDEVPPNYIEDDEETIRSGLAHWDSPILVLGAARSNT
jgi:hypothetical protein